MDNNKINDITISDHDIFKVLSGVFGYRSFRPGQKEVIDSILRGKDVLSVMPTLKFQTDRRCKKRVFRSLMTILTILFSLFMTAGRLLSGVHWVTDIIGSVFLSNGLFLLYAAMVNRADQKKTATVPWGKNYGIS